MTRAVRRPFGVAPGLARPRPVALVLAPQDIRTADPTRAEDIYAGYFVFGGRMVSGEGRSPFDIAPPTVEFARDLYGFGWLRHLRAAGTALSRANARALLSDYLAAEPRLRRGPAGEPAVAARRVLSWLSQSPFVLDGADGDFYRAFMRGLAQDTVLLARRWREIDGADRLRAAMALVETALCADLGAAALRRASALLVEELGRQIFPDGGHIARNPADLVDLLLDLLPLPQTFAARNEAAPQALVNAIDRMIPMVRLLRHVDGALALFNGMGVTEPDHIATVLAYDGSRGRALLNAPQAGYQRLEGGDAVAIVDAGAPPPGLLSVEAHAGCLSFEFSAGGERIVVNCGAPQEGRAVARQAARQTAAHSTLTIDDASSCRFAAPTGSERLLRGAIRGGPRTVVVERREPAEGATVDASHDGYARWFGLVHRRRLSLSRDGSRLAGQDRLAAAAVAGETQPERATLRFHLHPLVAAEVEADQPVVRLTTPGGAQLAFEARGGEVSVEESIFFAAPTGALRSRQIVVACDSPLEAAVDWAFTRL